MSSPRPQVRERILDALNGTDTPRTRQWIGVRLGYEDPPGWLRSLLEDMVTGGALLAVGGCSECKCGRKYGLAR